MFSRKSSRIAAAHAGSDSASEGTSSPCRSPAAKPSFPVRRKFHLQFLRFRISALLRLLKSMSVTCRQALTRWKKKKKPSCKPRVGLALSGAQSCTRTACAPDAIADCIEFIKRSASSPSSSSISLSSPLSQPPSHLRHDLDSQRHRDNFLLLPSE